MATPTQTQIDTVVGGGAAAVGSLAATMHMVTDVISLVTLAINFVIAAGGAYLLYLRIKRIKNKNSED